MSVARLSGEPAGRGSFSVPSASELVLAWEVIWVTSGTSWCACPGYAQRNTCRHVRAVDAAVQAEARALVATATPEQRAEAALRLARIETEFAL